MGILVNVKDWGVFQDKKMNVILEENLIVCFPPDTGRLIQQYNNLKHKTKYTLELLTDEESECSSVAELPF
jgi:hypothetical protein